MVDFDPLAAVTPEPWPLACSRLQQLHSHTKKNTTKLSVLNLCEQNILLCESTRQRGRHNIHVREHRRVGESPTWLWRVQTITEQSGRAFTFTSSKERQHTVSNNCCNPEIVRGGAESWLTKHLSLLVLTPSLNTHQPLVLEALHAHTISAGRSTRVGQSWRSEGAPDKILLCICQAVSTSLSSLPNKNCEVELSLNRGHDTRGAAQNLQIPLKNRVTGGEQ